MFCSPPFLKECLSHFTYHRWPFGNIIRPTYNTSSSSSLPVRVIYMNAPNAFEGIVCWHQHTTCLRFSSNKKMIRIFLIVSIRIIFVVIDLYYILVYSNNDYIADLERMILFAFCDSPVTVSDFCFGRFLYHQSYALTQFLGPKTAVWLESNVYSCLQTIKYIYKSL